MLRVSRVVNPFVEIVLLMRTYIVTSVAVFVLLVRIDLVEPRAVTEIVAIFTLYIRVIVFAIIVTPGLS